MICTKWLGLFSCVLLSSYTDSASAGHRWLAGMVVCLWSGGGIMLLAVSRRQGSETPTIPYTRNRLAGLCPKQTLNLLSNLLPKEAQVALLVNQWAEWWVEWHCLSPGHIDAEAVTKRGKEICPGQHNQWAAEPGAHPPTSLTQSPEQSSLLPE